MIKIRFYDNSTNLFHKFNICKKLLKEFEKINYEKRDLEIEYYCDDTHGTIKKLQKNARDLMYLPLEDAHYKINGNDICFVLLDLKWDEHSNLFNSILSMYNDKSNKGKVMVLLYSTAGTNTELEEINQSIMRKYKNLCFFEHPARIILDDTYIEHWCPKAAKILLDKSK